MCHQGAAVVYAGVPNGSEGGRAALRFSNLRLAALEPDQPNPIISCHAGGACSYAGQACTDHNALGQENHLSKIPAGGDFGCMVPPGMAAGFTNPEAGLQALRMDKVAAIALMVDPTSVGQSRLNLIISQCGAAGELRHFSHQLASRL